MKKIKLQIITEQQKAEIKIADDLNTKFISLLTHDLRAPFGTVIGFLSLLKTYLKKGKINESKEMIDMAYKSATQALALLDNLSIWAMDQKEGIKFSPMMVDIKQLLIDEIKFIEAGAKLKNIMIIDDINTEKHVLADKDMVKTIVRNLINNALKFSFPKGKIVISAHYRDTFTEVSIKDTGKGISMRGQKDLFLEKDSRITYGTAHEKGSCKGLIMCKEFIDLHGGEMRVESTPGKGSDFKFTLPHLPYYAAKTA